MTFELKEILVSDFKKRFPATAQILEKKVQTSYENDDRRVGGIDRYDFMANVQYFPEGDRDYSPSYGKYVGLDEYATKIYEIRSVVMTAYYPITYGGRHLALELINLSKENPEHHIPENELAAIQSFFDEMISIS